MGSNGHMAMWLWTAFTLGGGLALQVAELLAR